MATQALKTRLARLEQRKQAKALPKPKPFLIEWNGQAVDLFTVPSEVLFADGGPGQDDRPDPA